MRRTILVAGVLSGCVVSGVPGYAARQGAAPVQNAAPGTTQAAASGATPRAKPAAAAAVPAGVSLVRPKAILTPALAQAVDPVIEALWTSFRPQAAIDTVRFVSQYWRLAGNAGYDASIDRVHARLQAAGIADVADHTSAGPTPRAPRMWLEQYPSGHGWDYSIGTVAVVHPNAPEQIVLSKEKERLTLCINSFSTAPEGVTAKLVDVGGGDQESDYAKVDVKGAVVMGDAGVAQLWRRAIAHGAIGVISGELGEYVNPNPPGAPATPRETWNILQWGSLPYDEAHKGFGFKATPHAMFSLRGALAQGLSDVHVTVASTFTDKPARTLVMEIPGRVAPAERVVIAVHVQEPGANDNASGVATLTEMARSLVGQIRAGRIPAPARTMTFLWLEEINGSRQWLKDHADDAKNVKFMFSMDMTGEDVRKTGGSFLIERWPDPGAVWDRPWDPHTEWGRGNVRAESLKGDLINDLHEAICRRVATRSTWVVNTNPYEGGSDHTVFGSAGIPAVLDWHFTDRYYHTNYDTADKSSGAEMRNVAVSTGTTAWLMASAREPASIAVADFIARTGRARLAFETREGAKLAAADAKPDDAKARETLIATAWKKWYAEAVRSVSRFVVGTVPARLQQRIDTLAATFEKPAATGNATQATRAAATGAIATTFVCGVDESAPAVSLTWEHIVLAGDSRLYAPCPSGTHDATHREMRDAALLAAGLRSKDPIVRRFAVQELARNRLIRSDGAIAAGASRELAVGGKAGGSTGATNLLSDPDPIIRAEVANAIPESMTSDADVPLAEAALRSRLSAERDATVAGVLLESLGRLAYRTDPARAEIELVLANDLASPMAPRAFGAVKGLDWLMKQSPRRVVAGDTRAALRQCARLGITTSAVPTMAGEGTADADVPDAVFARARRLALGVLQRLGDKDLATLDAASRDADWQVRRAVAGQIDLSRPEFAAIAGRLAADPDFHVRFEIVGPLTRAAAQTKDCAPLVKLLGDVSPAVVMHALDALPATCDRADDVVRAVAARVDAQWGSPTLEAWHVPARALTALARLAPAQAAPLLAPIAASPNWHVRAAVATAAGAVRDDARAVALASDHEPNVQTAAIEALVAMHSPHTAEASIAVLKSGADDHQLLRAAALALKGAPAGARVDASVALREALDRATAAATDNSRDARVALLERLGELLPAEQASVLQPYLADFDPAVRTAAVKAFHVLGVEVAESRQSAVRYPWQVTAQELGALPTQAEITMSDGAVIAMALLVTQAPASVATFVKLARQGYYDGLTIHRVEPNFVVQGGSPGANEYSGMPRFMRDEAGVESNTRGAVGLSTRGRDTADGQFFIDLTDQTRLDHLYTVFARVTRGLDAVDRLLEGARITSVIVH